MLAKILRKGVKLQEKFNSRCRIFKLKLIYPHITIDYKSYIGKNVRINASISSTCEIVNCHISNGTEIRTYGNAVLKMKDSYLGYSCCVVAYKKIIISSHCEIAEMVVIRDQNHQYGSNELIKNAGFETSEIVIAENVWLGAKCTILKGVHLGNSVVVGANSLVNKSFDNNSVVGGIPAKLIKFSK
jgi:acetyltransferase-like isoleucine patch superfamily enzyme